MGGGNVYIKGGSANVQGTIYFKVSSDNVKMEITDSSITVSTTMIVDAAITTSSTFAVGPTSSTRATISNIYTGTFYLNTNINANTDTDISFSYSVFAFIFVLK